MIHSDYFKYLSYCVAYNLSISQFSSLEKFMKARC